jgi:hypothetical protein
MIGEFWVGIGIGPVDILFSLERIEKSYSLPLTVFDKSRITRDVSRYFDARMETRACLVSLVLLTSSLTCLSFNTKTRCELLEIGYFFLKLYEKLMAQTR